MLIIHNKGDYMRKLNNKGYLLVEIILASALAVGMAYFMIRLTINVKNKNDDLLVKSLTSTDQGIIYNYFMKKAATEEIDEANIVIDNQQLKYKGEVVINLNKYAKFGNKSKTNNYILIPITVEQLVDDVFDVIIYND